MASPFAPSGSGSGSGSGSRPYALPSVLLKDVLPSAGFVWPEEPYLGRDHDDDSRVAAALRASVPRFKKLFVEPLLVGKLWPFLSLIIRLGSGNNLR